MNKKYLSITTKLLLATCLALPLSSCSASKHAKAQEMQADLALREMRSQLDEQKYQMSRYEVELQVVEGKADSQTSLINTLRQELASLGSSNDTFIDKTLASYEKRLEKLETMELNLQADLDHLKEHTNEVLSSLAQYKTKIDFTEQKTLDQSRYIDHIKASLETLMDNYNAETTIESYVVVMGDTIETVASEHNLSVEKIKQLNHLNSDLLVAGQKLRLR